MPRGIHADGKPSFGDEQSRMCRFVHDGHQIGTRRMSIDQQAAVRLCGHSSSSRYPGNEEIDDRAIATIVKYIHERSVGPSSHP